MCFHDAANTFGTSSFFFVPMQLRAIHSKYRNVFLGCSCDVCLSFTFAAKHSSNWTSSLQYFSRLENYPGFEQNDCSSKFEMKNVLRTALVFIYMQKIGFEIGFN